MGQTWGQTGRTPVFLPTQPDKHGDRRDVPRFFSLRNRDEAGLAAIGYRLLWPSSFSRGQGTRSNLFQSNHELGCAQRSTRMGGVSQGRHIGGGLRVCQKFTPVGRGPSPAPALRFQHGIWAPHAAVRRCARPSPQSRCRHHPRTHRIQFDIAQRCPQVGFVQRTGIKSPLPYMPARRLPRIPVGSVASMRVFERLRERRRGLRNSDQVHVIRHQAVAQQRETVQLGVLPEQLQISEAIGIAGENDLSGIPPLRNMMGNVENYDTRQAGHSKKITERTRSIDRRCPGFSFVIPRSGGNNRGTSRLSPCFCPHVSL